MYRTCCIILCINCIKVLFYTSYHIKEKCVDFFFIIIIVIIIIIIIIIIFLLFS